jgi:hypothetical protein
MSGLPCGSPTLALSSKCLARSNKSGEAASATKAVGARLVVHRQGRGFDVSKHHYKIVVAMERSVETFKVVCAVTGETISIHQSRTEAQAAMRRYEATDTRRAATSYPGDMS